MKRISLFCLIMFGTLHFCRAQEWFTSFDVAKRLALVQNKMLFVIWEESMNDTYPIWIYDDNGKLTAFDLAKNDSLDPMIWEHFVPVKLPEYNYTELSHQVKETRGLKYYNKLIDDSIKIMDVNGNILNIDDSLDRYYFIDDYGYLDIADFIKRYSLNTSFLNSEFKYYSDNKTFTTAFRLASKYLDYAIFVEKDLRPDITALANIYFDEAKNFLEESSVENKAALIQKMELLQIKELLILNQTRKARRLIKKIDIEQIEAINQHLFAFLNYLTFKLLKDEENSTLWESKISSLDLKYSELILKNNTSPVGNNN